MARSIRNRKTEETVRKLAKLRGISMTCAIDQAVNRELASEEASGVGEWQRRLADVAHIQARSRLLPRIDERSDDEILGYGDDGLPS